VPLLVVHGTDDEVCPCWMARNLVDACPSPKKKLFCIDGGLHKNLHLCNPDALIWAVSQFIAELPHGRTFSVEEPPAIEQWTDNALRALRRFVRRKLLQQA
jgi:fermentation-respiration switch protein FrsA (DUF1100 family)